MARMAIITGDTYMIRHSLKSGGWVWDDEAKVWTKPTTADADESDVLRGVRMLAGVRNRGNFTVSIVDHP